MTLKYQVIDKTTGEDASKSWGGCSYVVTPDGKVAWWDDSQGWQDDDQQGRYEVRVLSHAACAHGNTRSIDGGPFVFQCLDCLSVKTGAGDWEPPV